MSLHSTDIAKVKRPSLRSGKPSALQSNRPTDDDTAYSKLIAINPLIRELVERLDLVSSKTGERINTVNTII